MPVTYFRDYFGNLDTSQPFQIVDKSGAQYTVTLDYNKCILTKTYTTATCTQNNGAHGQYDIVNVTGQTVVVDVPDMNVQYVRDEAGNVTYIFDYAMLLTTLYHYDAARNCIGERFKNAQGMIYQDTRIALNAMGWLTEVRDTMIQGAYTYDAKGNRRSTIVSVMGQNGTPGFSETTIQNWYTYNPADLVLIDAGVMNTATNTIQIQGGATPQGTILGYDAFGRRLTENTIDSSNVSHTKVIKYYGNDNVSQTWMDGNLNENFGFDANGNRISYSSNSGNTSSQMGYDAADRLISQQDFSTPDFNQKNSIALTNFEGYDANDNTHTQVTSVPNAGDAQQYQDTVTTSFVGFEQPVRTTVLGVRTGSGGSTPPAQIFNYNDSNGNPVSVQGDLSGSNTYRRFVVNAEGRIVFNQGSIILQGEDFEWYFYDPRTKQLLGRVGNLPAVSTTAPTVGQLTAPLPATDVNFDLGYQPTDANYPPPAPSTYTVPPNQGMTFDDVSSLMFGDSSFGDDIAIANNAAAGSDSILPGQVVKIPALSNTDLHNWQGNYRTYNVNAIIGPEYPNMPLPPVKPIHHSFWGELFEAVVGIVGIALDIVTAGAAIPAVDIALAQLAR